MDEAFNLLDEPWLAVRMHDGQVRELGLLALFEQAGEISALAETSPPSLIAQYRLLLAITHRAISQAQGRWTDAERLRWYQDGLPLSAIRDYLQRWRERFWLFHPQYPSCKWRRWPMSRKRRRSSLDTQYASLSFTVRRCSIRVYNREPEYPAPC